MAETVAPRTFSRTALYFAAAVAGLGLAAAISMWAKLGTALFFESIRNGFAYCFG